MTSRFALSFSESHRLGRRSLLAFGAVFGVAGGSSAFAAGARETPLRSPTSLPLAAASAPLSPLVLLVSLPGCPYCELIRRNYLVPMRQAEGLNAWQINVTDSQTPLQDFAPLGQAATSGPTTTPSAVASRLKARFTPTLLFFNMQGQEVAERIEGIGSVDFFGAYLDARLTTARAATVVGKAS